MNNQRPRRSCNLPPPLLPLPFVKKKGPKRQRRFPCAYCDEDFSTYYQHDCHFETVHLCNNCGRSFHSLLDHEPECPQVGFGPTPGTFSPQNIDESVFKIADVVHRGELMAYNYKPSQNFKLVASLVDSVEDSLVRLIEQNLDHFGAIRIKLLFYLTIVQMSTGIKRSEVPTSSNWVSIGHRSFIAQALATCINYVTTNLDYMCETKSEVSVDSLDLFYILVGDYVVPRGRGSREPLPSSLRNRRGLLNPQAPSSLCFHQCILMALFKDQIVANCKRARKLKSKSQSVKKNSKLANYIEKTRDTVNFKNYRHLLRDHGVDFSQIGEGGSVTLFDLDHFENLNINISVTIYKMNARKLHIIRPTKTERPNHVNLLYVENTKGEGHYILIESLKSFLYEKNCKSFCSSCGKNFMNSETLKKHNCLLKNKCKKLKSKSQFSRFEKIQFTLRQPYLLYFNLHKIRINRVGGETCLVVVGYTLFVLTPEGIQDKSTYYGKNPMRHFLNQSLELSKKYVNLIKETNVEPQPTEEELNILKSATHCTFCRRAFIPNSISHRVVVHHHHTYGTCAILPSKASPSMIICNTCNLKAKKPTRLTAVMFSEEKNGVEFHFLVEGFEGSKVTQAVPLSRKGGQTVGLILNNILRVIDFGNFRIDGTFWELAKEMQSAGEKFRLLEKTLGEFSLIFEKFPQLIARSEAEFHHLLDTELHKRRFEHEAASTIETLQQAFQLNTFRDYVSLIDHLETVILADMFEHFRDMAMEYYSLDPSHVYTGSRYSFDSAFFFDRVQVELVSDDLISTMVERGLRGAVVLLSESYLKANTTRYGLYDSKLPTLNILSVDENSQYAGAMCQKLPKCEFHYLSQAEIDTLDIASIDLDGEHSYILDVDIHIPDHLHTLFQSYPPVCEKRLVEFEMLSSSQRGSLINPNIQLKEERLLSTLFDKQSNVHHIGNLKYFLQLGIQIRKINAGFRYRQAHLFKRFVEFNVEKRMEAKSKFMDNFFKNLNNFVTGRLSLSPNQYSTARFCRSSHQFRRFFARHTFDDVTRITDKTSLFQFKKSESQNVNFRVISLVVYEIAKLGLLKTIYSELIPLFGPTSFRIAHSHTDSLLCAVTCSDEEFINKLKSISHLLDTSKLDAAHPLYSTKNRLVMGKLKMQDYIIEFVGLKPACYSILFHDNTEKCKSSGIPMKENENYLRHETYLQTWRGNLSQEQVVVPLVKIKDGQVMELKIFRRGLQNLDISRFQFGNITLPFGHFLLRRS